LPAAERALDDLLLYMESRGHDTQADIKSNDICSGGVASGDRDTAETACFSDSNGDSGKSSFPLVY
jgi:hypothetical protein